MSWIWELISATVFPMYLNVSGVNLKSAFIGPELDGGRDSRGLEGKPESRDKATGGLYGSVPKRDTYPDGPSAVNHLLFILACSLSLSGIESSLGCARGDSDRRFRGKEVILMTEVRMKMLYVKYTSLGIVIPTTGLEHLSEERDQARR